MKAFQTRAGVFPQRVVVYRDGVGAGQETILQTEAEQYRLAFKTLNAPVQLVIVLCNKRVSTKLILTII
jgi:aubergine-like protein